MPSCDRKWSKAYFFRWRGGRGYNFPIPIMWRERKNSQQWRRGGALIGYAALQELLNNGGVHSQSSWKKKRFNFSCLPCVFSFSLGSISTWTWATQRNLSRVHLDMRYYFEAWWPLLNGSACQKGRGDRIVISTEVAYSLLIIKAARAIPS